MSGRVLLMACPSSVIGSLRDIASRQLYLQTEQSDENIRCRTILFSSSMQMARQGSPACGLVQSASPTSHA